MAELTDDELEAIKLQARESVDYAAAGCVRGSRMGLRLADAAERRALYQAGRKAAVDAILAHLDDASCRVMHGNWKRAADVAAERLSCGCPPEHHDEAVRRLADRMRRDGVIAEGPRDAD